MMAILSQHFRLTKLDEVGRPVLRRCCRPSAVIAKRPDERERQPRGKRVGRNHECLSRPAGRLARCFARGLGGLLREVRGALHPLSRGLGGGGRRPGVRTRCRDQRTGAQRDGERWPWVPLDGIRDIQLLPKSVHGLGHALMQGCERVRNLRSTALYVAPC